MTWTWAICILLGYFGGSLPFAFLLGKWHGIDIRTVGSGNVGATNLGRALGKKWGFTCFGLDVLKGTLPVLVAGVWQGVLGKAELAPLAAWLWLAVGAAAVTGHMFPVWLGFKGGKGVATGLGVVIAYYPLLTLPGLISLATWLTFAGLFRYVSLASIVGAVLLPAYLIAVSRWQDASWVAVIPFLIVSSVLALLVVVRHRANIGRLMAGTESKIGQAKQATQDKQSESAMPDGPGEDELVEREGEPVAADADASPSN